MLIEIEDLNAPELDVYARLNERQLLHYDEPNGGLLIAESPYIIEMALDRGLEPVSVLAEKRTTAENRTAQVLARIPPEIPVYTAVRSVLKALTGFELTRGMLCCMKRPARTSLQTLLEQSSRLVILENVMNPTNVGAILRSAAALGIDGVILTPGSSDPFYRRALRVSMGTAFQIPWVMLPDEPVCWPIPLLDELKTTGYTTAAMALSDHAISLDDPKLENIGRLALVMGTEGTGLDEKTITCCDYTVRIPMQHGVDSLNVAAASAVAFWQTRRK